MPGNAQKKCPKAGELIVQVRRQSMKDPKSWDRLSSPCGLKLTPQAGQTVESPTDNITDRTTFTNLCEGAYTLDLKPQGEEADLDVAEAIDRKTPERDIANALGLPVEIVANKPRIHYYTFRLHVLRVIVVDNVPNKIDNIVVKATPIAGGSAHTGKTGQNGRKGEVDFGRVRNGRYRLEVVLGANQKDKYRVTLPGANGEVDAQRMGQVPYEIKIVPSGWVEFLLVEAGSKPEKPISKIAIKAELPGKKTVSKPTGEDAKGLVRFEELPEGTCAIHEMSSKEDTWEFVSLESKDKA